MAVFSDDPESYDRVDWDLLQNGPINLYWRAPYLAEHVQWLKGDEYEINEFDCSSWVDEAAMHGDIAAGLGFPDYYGRNLDALNDCLSDLDVPTTGGRVLVLQRYDLLTRACPAVAQHVLDIIAHQSRRFLLFGRRFFALVQSDDPTIAFQPVGATPVNWNRREWLKSNRGL